MSNNEDVVHLTPESYVRILSSVAFAIGKLHKHRQDEIEQWRNDDTARQAELDAHLEEQYLYRYGSGYDRYLDEISKANNVPLTFLEKIGLRKRELLKDEFGSKRAFADNQYHQSGETDYFIDGIPDDEAGRPWELVDRWINRYCYGSDSHRNQYDVEAAEKELSRVREGGPNVKFTISRHRYDRMIQYIEASRKLEVKESV